MAARNLFTKKFNINKARYSILFSFNNVYSIFKRKNTDKENNALDSMKYNCDSAFKHNCSSCDDVLLDLFYQNKANLVSIKVNDIICIKINDVLFSYQVIKKSSSFSLKDYHLIDGFFDREYEFYINKIHDEGYVLNVIDGLLLDTAIVKQEKNKYFCIEEETFENKGNKVSSISSFYSFFSLDLKGRISKSCEFISFANALYHFDTCKKNNPSSVLLLNRNELFMIADNEFVNENKFVYEY